MHHFIMWNANAHDDWNSRLHLFSATQINFIIILSKLLPNDIKPMPKYCLVFSFRESDRILCAVTTKDSIDFLVGLQSARIPDQPFEDPCCFLFLWISFFLSQTEIHFHNMNINARVQSIARHSVHYAHPSALLLWCEVI